MATRRVEGGRRALSKKLLATERKKDPDMVPLSLLELKLNRLYQEVRRRNGKLPR